MGKKGNRKRGQQQQQWGRGSPTWRGVIGAAEAGGCDADGVLALHEWLAGVGGNATLLVLTSEQGRAQEALDKERPAGAEAAPALGEPEPEPEPAAAAAARPTARGTGAASSQTALHAAQSEAEMLAAVKLCKRAFVAAKSNMRPGFWEYDPADASRPTAFKDVPYCEAVAWHQRLLDAGEVPTRQYFLYAEPASARPTAAIVMEVLAPSVWVIALMGSNCPGHGLRALEELKRLAFRERRVLVLEALNGATTQHQKLSQWYARCGFQFCGNTPAHLSVESAAAPTSAGAVAAQPAPQQPAEAAADAAATKPPDAPLATGLGQAAAAELCEYFTDDS